MKNRLSAALVAVAMLLTFAGAASALPGPGGKLGRPTPCPSTGCATPNPSATPRPTPFAGGVVPSVSLVPTPEKPLRVLLPDTSE